MVLTFYEKLFKQDFPPESAPDIPNSFPALSEDLISLFSKEFDKDEIKRAVLDMKSLGVDELHARFDQHIWVAFIF